MSNFNRIDFLDALVQLRKISVARCARWHGGNGVADWSGLEWAGAMCGEAGEAANVAKKIKRVESEMKSISFLEDDTLKTAAKDDEFNALVGKLGKELADTFLYLDLLAARYGIDLGENIIYVFNKKSAEYGFPERL